MRGLIPPGSTQPLDWARLGPDLHAQAGNSRPWVSSNFVTSLDGRVTLRGHAAGIGSEDDQRVLVALRASFDGVMIGAQTLRAERYGPLLSGERDRLSRIRTENGDAPDPVAITVSHTLDLPWTAPLFTRGIGRVIIATTSADDPPSTETEVEVLRFDGAHVPLPQLMQRLRHECGLRTILCEGGPTLLAELTAHNLLDELFVTVAPRLIGEQPDGLTMLHGTLPAPQDLELVSLVEHDSELFTRWHVRRGPGAG
jgi:riboflavin-specific deaminase-like protein